MSTPTILVHLKCCETSLTKCNYPTELHLQELVLSQHLTQLCHVCITIGRYTCVGKRKKGTLVQATLLTTRSAQFNETNSQSGSRYSSNTARRCKNCCYTSSGKRMPKALKTLHHGDGVTLQARTPMQTPLRAKEQGPHPPTTRMATKLTGYTNLTLYCQPPPRHYAWRSGRICHHIPPVPSAVVIVVTFHLHVLDSATARQLPQVCNFFVEILVIWCLNTLRRARSCGGGHKLLCIKGPQRPKLCPATRFSNHAAQFLVVSTDFVWICTVL